VNRKPKKVLSGHLDISVQPYTLTTETWFQAETIRVRSLCAQLPSAQGTGNQAQRVARLASSGSSRLALRTPQLPGGSGGTCRNRRRGRVSKTAAKTHPADNETTSETHRGCNEGAPNFRASSRQSCPIDDNERQLGRPRTAEKEGEGPSGQRKRQWVGKNSSALRGGVAPPAATGRV